MNRPTLGSPAAWWYPRTQHAYQRQVVTQAGPWAGPETPSVVDAHTDKLAADVKAVTRVFHERGTRAGIMEARSRGVAPGARLYLDVRAETEERLAVRVAKLRVEVMRAPSGLNRQLLAFAEARLAEVRGAVKNGSTPPQAVADKPDLPRTEVPRWVPITALALSALALAGSVLRRRS